MQRLAILLLPAAILLPDAGADETPAAYVHQDSWAQSMTATRRRLAALDQPDAAAGPRHSPQRNAGYAELCRRFWKDFPQPTDWFLQDSPYPPLADAPLRLERQFGWYFAADRDAQPEHQLIRRALADLPDAAELRGQLQSLIAADTAVDDPAWLQLYVAVCQRRRAQRLQPWAAQVPAFVFTKHYTLGGSHYAYTEGQSDAQAERHFVPGTALCLARWDGRRYQVETLIEDPGGVIRDPDVSCDGRRVLFAWKKSDRHDDYHLYELELASREVRQLTSGLGVADYEGCYLPDGEILFNSTRCVQIVDCWWTEVSNLYRCDGQGRYLRRITFDQVHDNYPTLTDDGRVLYTRWEYNDRGQVYPQPLLQMHPDGTGQSEFYGVNSWFPTTILHARGVPGTQKVLAIATGHHSRQTGKLILIDPARGRQENEGVQLLAPRRATPAVKIDAFGQQGDLFQYPYPLSETEYLVTWHPVGWPWAEGPLGPRFGIYFMDAEGRRELLVDDPRLPCSQPVPLRPRPAVRIRPSQVDYRQTTGTCYVQDVYAGPGLQGVPRGTIRTLRVIALDFRAAGIGSNNNGGPGGAALISTPIAVGNGSWDPKIILGDVPVQADGSAFFQVPARTPLYYQLLDQRGQMVQTMRSWTSLQPAENATCVGCHEHKNSAPLAAPPRTMALGQGPQPLQPYQDRAPRGFSFPEQIQPIIDQHCAECHSGAPGAPFGLTRRSIEDPKARRRWSEAYLALTHAQPDDGAGGGWRGDADHPVLNWVSSQSAPPLQPPYSAGAARSKLLELLDQGHEGVALTAEQRAKLAAWIDLGVPYCGDYTEANTWSAEERAKYDHYLAKRRRLAAADARSIWALQTRSEPSASLGTSR